MLGWLGGVGGQVTNDRSKKGREGVFAVYDRGCSMQFTLRDEGMTETKILDWIEDGAARLHDEEEAVKRARWALTIESELWLTAPFEPISSRSSLLFLSFACRERFNPCFRHSHSKLHMLIQLCRGGSRSTPWSFPECTPSPP